MPDVRCAILLIGHGSRVAEANQGLQEIAGLLRRMQSEAIVEVCFGEHAEPDIQTGIKACVVAGARRILLCPYFLAAGAHVLKDLPAELELGRKRHPDIELQLTEPLGIHTKLAEVVLERCQATAEVAGWSWKGER